jgi:hypothetical protein
MNMLHTKSALLICLIAAVGCHAFVSTSPRSAKRSSSSLRLSPLHLESINRRELLQSTTNIFGAAAASTFFRPSIAEAATSATASKSPQQIVSQTLCDPSVSTWIKTYNDVSGDGPAMRTVHILGTAHISSASAELAGKMVRELKPNVVFVELDAKRVKRAIPSAASTAISVDGAESDGTSIGNGETQSALSPLKAQGKVTSTPTSIAPKSNPFDLQNQAVNFGSKYVGNAVKGMYGKLESEGFKAGDEFAMSVREGLALGSTIVLGDRDVEVTLRRLTQALAKTDFRKLLSSDSEVERSMEELLPDNLKAQLMKQSSGQAMDGINVSSMGLQEVAVDKAEFQSFVETMKVNDNVKKIMSALK